ncbi:MAG: M20/M25/M40 family metallo-hydrolase, partial [candidate division Zixibacteria bacterium]|nr:M20/M25/M40 family metallo-hydrolase [candidate division Zixibacteria bacterium]
MKKIMVCLFSLVIIVFFFTSYNSFGSFASNDNYLVKVDLKTKDDLIILKNTSFTAFTKTSGFIIGAADEYVLEQLKGKGLDYTILDKDPYLNHYYFGRYRGKESISGVLQLIKEKVRVLYQEGNTFLVSGEPADIKVLAGYQLSLKRIFQRALPLELPEVERELYKAPAYSPVIANMISQVRTEDILDYVKDLSGERSVLIGGVLDSIPTRLTGTSGNAKAVQYLLERFEEVGVEVYPDTFYLPYEGMLSDVKAGRDGQTAWLCSNRGWILRTVNGGTRWNTVAGTETFSLSTIFRLTDDTIWAVGFEGIVVNSIDKGASWTEKTKPYMGALLGVYFESNLSGWVVGESGSIYYTPDEGTSWLAQSSGTTKLLYNITFSEPDKGWIVGPSGTLLHTTDGGSNWNPVSLGITRDLLDIEFVTPEKGWIVGSFGTVFYTTDGGMNWLSKDVGLYSTINSLCFAPDDTLKGWMISFSGKSIVRTEDGGENWSVKSIPAGYFSIDFSNSQVGWATGGVNLGISTNSGSSWTSQFNNIAAGTPHINVVATIPGEVFPTQEYLITAHYDDVSGAVYAPGADDNASGVAAVLKAAAIMKEYEFQKTVKFVCFAAEEDGLIGSEVYAAKAKSQGVNIKGVLNFDMISYDGNKDGHIQIDTDSNSLSLADFFLNILSEYEFGLIPRLVIITGADYSDHAS